LPRARCGRSVWIGGLGFLILLGLSGNLAALSRRQIVAAARREITSAVRLACPGRTGGGRSSGFPSRRYSRLGHDHSACRQEACRCEGEEELCFHIPNLRHPVPATSSEKRLRRASEACGCDRCYSVRQMTNPYRNHIRPLSIPAPDLTSQIGVKHAKRHDRAAGRYPDRAVNFIGFGCTGYKVCKARKNTAEIRRPE
jgi:hypothetical protein